MLRQALAGVVCLENQVPCQCLVQLGNELCLRLYLDTIGTIRRIRFERFDESAGRLREFGLRANRDLHVLQAVHRLPLQAQPAHDGQAIVNRGRTEPSHHERLDPQLAGVLVGCGLRGAEAVGFLSLLHVGSSGCARFRHIACGVKHVAAHRYRA
jgi:hypothetical protein